MQFFTVILSALALAVSTTTATPIDSRTEPIAFTLNITNPVADEVWYVGDRQVVKWDTSAIPEEAENYRGTIFLGMRDGVTPSKHLDHQHRLARGFLLRDGEQTVTVPYKPYGRTYFVYLVGEGNTGSFSPDLVIMSKPGS